MECSALTKWPCGKCGNCLEKRRNEWTFRLAKEWQESALSYFITITYNDKFCPGKANGNYTLDKKEAKLFLKRFKRLQLKHAPEVKAKYYLVGEYGTRTNRPHYHALLFHTDIKVIRDLGKIWTDPKTGESKGFIQVSLVTPARIHYVSGYCLMKGMEPKGCEPGFALMSRNPAIGKKYQEIADKYPSEYVKIGKHKMSLPRYYRVRKPDYDPMDFWLKEPELNSERYFRNLKEIAILKRNNPNIENIYKYRQETVQNDSKRKINQLTKKRL